MKDNKQIMCDECKRLVPLSDVRYSIKGNLRLCSDCRNRTTSRKKLDTKNEVNIINNEKNIIKEIKKPQKLDKSEYFCTRCRYKFKHDSSGDNKLKCPYCSSSAYVTSLKSLSSNKLLKEVEDFD